MSGLSPQPPTPPRRVLVANRGEIAVRVIRACHDLGWTAIAVHSDVDADSLHVRLADEAVEIGPAAAAQSYLRPEAILDAARRTGAQAIHPGYGFLSENADFAQAVIDAGLRWVGPSPHVIALMGDKETARRTARDAGVPVVPGSDLLADADAALAAAEQVGYPVLVKARAGGGGKGIRAAADAGELAKQFEEAGREVKGAFGDDGLYLERSLQQVRHVEVQILGDSQGNVVHLFERECSLQRRRQKVIEEAPAPTLDREVAAAMHASAVALAAAVGYTSAGTVEFLVDPSGEYFFIEMNTRIQVEHGVTEELTGVDLVVEQLRIAFDEPIGVKQEEIAMRGAVIELRLNAENPKFHFFGCPGAVNSVTFPAGPGVRVDTGVVSGSTIQPHYDSMVAKVVVAGASREQAIARATRAAGETLWDGPITTLGFLRDVLGTEWFQDADFHTGTIDEKLPELLESL
ncbi:ATP-grasp domain-containing protein [Gordonia jinghuaiqii]|uniref:biotin carboxylase n=1 Tax=Gordonia jinghuaiqii TaxID=2758710 RepID=A0A7D7LSS2_9ACTN|nr:biotin carboxylase N-terminal domain-containing protein [Gordonia jinghuaiqii]MCR5977868.1 ATP-grasp domain-containing protein [Gordonia jinghuaiqii]QMT02525.1 ATP-grasp domain-containing protein [Gordonia jinghuaiqii]